MTPNTILMLARFAAHAAFAIALLGSTYSFRVFYAEREIIVETVRALAPANSERMAEIIESNISPTGEAALVRKVVQSEQQQTKLLHQGWLQYVEANQITLRNQLILWLAVLVPSFIVLVVLHRGKNAL